ncbi:MAG: anti-anti-sigma regulatory factor [Pirellulaceae bacterium]|jgi:anti-anti-sigma regulatory factor
MLKERIQSDENQDGIFETSIEDGVLTIRLLTKTLMDDNVTDLIVERIVGLLDDSRAVVLDCQESIRHVSSRFLSLLLTIQHQAKQRSISFSVCQLGPEMVEMFKVTCLNKQIPAFTSRQEAIECLDRNGSWDIDHTTIDDLKEKTGWAIALSQFVHGVRISARLFL